MLASCPIGADTSRGHGPALVAPPPLRAEWRLMGQILKWTHVLTAPVYSGDSGGGSDGDPTSRGLSVLAAAPKWG